MKKVALFIALTVLVLALIGCGIVSENEENTENISNSEIINQETHLDKQSEETQDVSSEQDSDEAVISKEDSNVKNIEIVVGDKVYSARLYDNETAQAFAEMLPLTLDMSELNGNEKYYYFTDSLPTDSNVPDRINTGDLMLYGSSCLVLFYESFSTSYRYTPLGYMENPDNLAQTLGGESISITFRIAE